MKFLATALSLAALWQPSAAATIGFETFVLPPAGFLNGSDGGGGFSIDGATFLNNYDDDFGSWSGFAISNVTDNTTRGFPNQYSAITGGGVDGSANYAVGYFSTYDFASTHIVFDSLTNLVGRGTYITNTTWAYFDMLEGGSFGSKQFGGASGDDPDWFKLVIEGFGETNNSTGVVEFYLADFRFADNALDYIVNKWSFVDLSALGGSVKRVEMSMDSSDVGAFGINTPTYFAMDNFMAVPEPSSLMAAICGLGLLLRRRR